MESEVELHETIQEMHAVATVPDLYPIMVELQAVPSLLELLAHENTDIAVAVVDLLQVSILLTHDNTGLRSRNPRIWP
jgi:beta-catenin-like protein 1